jgi:hypothetical protein
MIEGSTAYHMSEHELYFIPLQVENVVNMLTLGFDIDPLQALITLNCEPF